MTHTTKPAAALYIVADDEGDYLLTITSDGYRDDCDRCLYDTHGCTEPDSDREECQGPVGHNHFHDVALLSELEPWELEEVRQEVQLQEEERIFGPRKG